MNEFERKENVEPLALIQYFWQTSKCAEAHVDTLLAEAGLSHAKLWGLSQLASEDEPLQLRELAQKMGGAKSNATQLVDRLVADGLVQRVFDPEDRRNVLIELTDEGKERYERSMKVLQQAAQTVFADFTPEQYCQFSEMLKRFRANLPERRCGG